MSGCLYCDNEMIENPHNGFCDECENRIEEDAHDIVLKGLDGKVSVYFGMKDEKLDKLNFLGN